MNKAILITGGGLLAAYLLLNGGRKETKKVSHRTSKDSSGKKAKADKKGGSTSSKKHDTQSSVGSRHTKSSKTIFTRKDSAIRAAIRRGNKVFKLPDGVFYVCTDKAAALAKAQFHIGKLKVIEVA